MPKKAPQTRKDAPKRKPAPSPEPKATKRAAAKPKQPAAKPSRQAASKPDAKQPVAKQKQAPTRNRRTERARSSVQGEARPPEGEPREHVDPPATPWPGRTAFAGEPDKSFRFTKPRRDRFIMLLKSTLPIDRVCERIGCSEDTPRDWRKAGHAALAARERGETLDARAEEQAEFATQMDDALTSLETELITRVQEGARRDWRAAAWRLSVMRPETYSERYQASKLKVDSEKAITEQEERGKRLAADILEEKLAAVREAKKDGGQILVIGDMDLIEHLARATDLPDTVNADDLMRYLADNGFRMLEVRDLGGVDPMKSTHKD